MNESNGVLDFDAGEAPISLIQIPVKYQGRAYILTEASEDAATQWRNSQIMGTKLQQVDDSDVKTVSIGKMADAEPLLVSLCLYVPGPDGNLRLDGVGNADPQFRVASQVIKKWPARVVTPLYDKIMEISGLNKKDTVESLDKQISSLQKRRQKLVDAQEKSKEEVSSEEEALAKN